MLLHSIRLINFRNYSDISFALSDGVNIICGENAQGKTNFLEAVSYLSCVRSFRTQYKKELISFGADYSKLSAVISSRNRRFEIEAEIYEKKPPLIYVNKVKLRQNAKLAGLLKSVCFIPEDLFLIKGGAMLRRRFLDDALTQLKPQYAEYLSEYGRLMDHKIRILKDSAEKPDLLSALDDFTLRMLKIGAQLIKYRAAFISMLIPEAETIYSEISGLKEKLTALYKTVSNVTNPEGDIRDIENELIAHFDAHRRAEILTKTCLTGPHKDDMELFIDLKPARAFASQGQARTAALSLKLAEREMFFKDAGEYPVLLLDDVLSELDPKRQDFVLNRISGGQVLITCCEDEKPSRVLNGRLFTIRDGGIEGIREINNNGGEKNVSSSGP